MKHYTEVGIADSVAAFISSPDVSQWDIFWFQIQYVHILTRQLGVRPQL